MIYDLFKDISFMPFFIISSSHSLSRIRRSKLGPFARSTSVLPTGLYRILQTNGSVHFKSGPTLKDITLHGTHSWAPARGGLEAHGALSVSYTHLDVYKRRTIYFKIEFYSIFTTTSIVFRLSLIHIF